MRRILVTGSSGQLGQELQPFLAPLGEVSSLSREQLDLAQPEAIATIVADLKPDIVINAGAYTAVDRAETETDLAFAVNGKAPGVLAKAAQQVGATLVHISTDYVFDGTQSHPYQDTDPTNPIGAYGKSKLMGEEAVKANCDRYLLIRTAWVYGSHGKSNFVKTMLRLGAEREELRVVFDQVGSPTWTGDLAQAIAQLVPHLSPEFSPELTGTYHYTNSGVCSWYDFAIAIFEEAKAIGFPLKVERVVPITTAEYPTPARRPAYSVLSCAKISKVLGTHPPHWRQGLRQMLAELYSLTH